MSDITKIKVDGELESSYQLYPRNEEFAKRAGVADISLSVTGATVGQIAKITAVDDSGKPTAWVAVDMPAGGGGGGGGGGEITTLHIDVTAVNLETREATFTADKTPTEMQQASANGPIWCVVTFAAGIMAEEAISFATPPSWAGGIPAFGDAIMRYHNAEGYNIHNYAVLADYPNSWILNLEVFGS